MAYEMYVVEPDGQPVESQDYNDPRYNLFRSRIECVHLVRQLEAAGMGTLTIQDPPVLPEPWDYEDDTTYQPALHSVARDALGVRGIALHKLLCGDYGSGWWVTAEECAAALEAWCAAGEPELEAEITARLEASRSRLFLPFLREAARHAGFRVHEPS